MLHILQLDSSNNNWKLRLYEEVFAPLLYVWLTNSLEQLDTMVYDYNIQEIPEQYTGTTFKKYNLAFPI